MNDRFFYPGQFITLVAFNVIVIVIMNTKLSVIIPVYNESKTISLTLEKVIAVKLIQGIQMEIIVINDCSNDNSAQIIDEFAQKNTNLEIKVFHQAVNRGKGAAIRNGIELATGDYIVIQDADLEYNPQEFNLLLQPILDGFADVVYGSRLIGGRAHRTLFFFHSVGNRFITFLSNLFTNLNLSDIESCYKLFKADIIKKIKLKEDRFGFEPEITAKISRIPNIRIYEVGISYYGRTYEEGKKINWKDGIRAIYCILKFNTFCRKPY